MLFYDATGDLNMGNGDYINLPFDIPFSLTDKGSTPVTVQIDFLIP